MTNRRGLLGGLLSLPFFGKAGDYSQRPIVRYSEAVLGEYLPLQTAKGWEPGIIHILKAINPKTGIVANNLGLGVLIISPQGIFTGDKTYADV